MIDTFKKRTSKEAGFSLGKSLVSKQSETVLNLKIKGWCSQRVVLNAAVFVLFKHIIFFEWLPLSFQKKQANIL